MNITPKLVVAAVALLVLTILGFSTMQTVSTGHRGIEVRFGKVEGEALTEGLYFVNPFTTDIVEMDVRVLKWPGETMAYTKDVQQATVHFVLTYRLNPDEAHITYREIGSDWSEKLVGQVVLEQIKREFGQYEAVNLIAKRETAARKIEADVINMLSSRRVVVTGFQLTNIDYTPQFEKAVEAKVVAQQSAIEEQNRTVQVQEKANQQIVAAKGNAEATVLNAKADAESISIRARALEQNAKLVEWEAVQKWNGVLPVYTMGGATPFIQLPSR